MINMTDRLLLVTRACDPLIGFGILLTYSCFYFEDQDGNDTLDVPAPGIVIPCR